MRDRQFQIQYEFIGRNFWVVLNLKVAVTHFCFLRQGWVLFKQTCVFSGIQFTKHFIEFVFVETNEVVCSNSTMILTQQTCGQRSSRVVGSNCER
jgi:Tfp pilus assembly PilM family ATPase